MTFKIRIENYMSGDIIPIGEALTLEDAEGHCNFIHSALSALGGDDYGLEISNGKHGDGLEWRSY